MSATAIHHVPFEGTSHARNAFDALPARVYAEDTNWAPASASVAQQVWQGAASGAVDLFPVVLIRDGKAVARAAAILPVTTSSAASGWIGLLECLPGESEAGVACVATCRSWLQGRGVRDVAAPQSNSLVSGLLREGFDKPQSFLTPYNPPWYADILAAAGFVPASQSVAFEFTRANRPTFGDAPPTRFRVRPVDPADLPGEVARIHGFQESVFAGHPGHHARALDQTYDLATQLLPAVDPDLILIAEDQADATIGILVCIPDVWQRRPLGAGPTRARLMSLGVTQSWRRSGVATAMGAALATTLVAKGYDTLEASVVMVDNQPPQNLATFLGARITRRFQMYRLTPEAEDAHPRTVRPSP